MKETLDIVEKDYICIKFKQFLIDNGLVSNGDRIILAVSGGSDSVAMLHLFYVVRKDLGLDIHVACVDHGIRTSALKEAEYVHSLSTKFGFPFYLLKGNAPEEASIFRRSLEDAARQMRYRLLSKLRLDIGASKVATGHTMDDNAETLMMNILRGCGVQGLRGIDIRREDIFIRPVLCFRREELINYLKRRKILFYSDPSNESESFMRCRIRRKIMPLLQTENRRVSNLLWELSKEAQEVQDFLEVNAEEFIKKNVIRRGDEWVLSRKNFSGLHPAMKVCVIRKMFENLSSTLLGFYRVHVREVLDVIESGGGSKKIFLPRGLELRREYDDIVFLQRTNLENSFQSEVKIDGTGNFVHEELGVVIEVELTEPGKDLLLVLRSRRNGDKLYGRKKKLKEVLIDRKIPVRLRDFIPILAEGDHVVWACGVLEPLFSCLKVKWRRIEKHFNPYFDWLESKRDDKK